MMFLRYLLRAGGAWQLNQSLLVARRAKSKKLRSSGDARLLHVTMPRLARKFGAHQQIHSLSASSIAELLCLSKRPTTTTTSSIH